MAKQLKNYKLSSVGLDNDGFSRRLVFFVYAVEVVENARNIVRDDKVRRRMMRRQNVDWKTAELRAVRCNRRGEVTDSDIPQELEIMMVENQEIKDLIRIQRARHWLIGEQDV